MVRLVITFSLCSNLCLASSYSKFYRVSKVIVTFIILTICSCRVMVTCLTCLCSCSRILVIYLLVSLVRTVSRVARLALVSLALAC